MHWVTGAMAQVAPKIMRPTSFFQQNGINAGSGDRNSVSGLSGTRRYLDGCMSLAWPDGPPDLTQRPTPLNPATHIS